MHGHLDGAEVAGAEVAAHAVQPDPLAQGDLLPPAPVMVELEAEPLVRGAASALRPCNTGEPRSVTSKEKGANLIPPIFSTRLKNSVKT